MQKKYLHFLVAFISILGIGALLVYAAGEVIFTGSFGDSHSTGSFSLWGNAGIVSFDNIPAGFSGSQAVGLSGSSSVYLTGIFFLQTVGWATFSDVGMGGAEIIPPVNSIRDPWYLSGYAWSENAGWMKLNHGESYASGVWYIPDTMSLTWFAWSNTLWWIPFDSKTASVEAAFIGKATVWGSIWGVTTFSTLYTPGTTFWAWVDGATLGGFLNTVRKNVQVISRNATGNSKVNSNFNLSTPVNITSAILYKKATNPTWEYFKYSTISTAFNNATDKIRSVVVIWADIYIDADVISSTFSFPRTFITLQNDLWQWGNIYIKWSVKKIEASLIAERTIFSGDDPGTWLTPYFINKKSVFLDLPKTQLYIKWLVASYNTFWWSSKTGGAVCPAFTRNSIACNYDTAIPYDWNYFRSFDHTAGNRAYKDSSKDSYSVVMEPDPRLIQDPPPWLENTR